MALNTFLIPLPGNGSQQHISDGSSNKNAFIAPKVIANKGKWDIYNQLLSNEITKAGMGNPLALKQELATWIMPMKPILNGIQRKNRVAVSTTIGLLSIRLTKYAPNWIITMKVKTPHA